MINESLIPAERIERRIPLIRGQKVMLDSDLAELYEVPTKVLNQAVKRNIERFPKDFMFQLSEREHRLMMQSLVVTPKPNAGDNTLNNNKVLRSQIVTSKTEPGSGGRRFRPYAFTEQGVAMLSSVLRSRRAVEVNITIMRTFVKLRALLVSHASLARKLEALERRYDARFKIVFEAIRELMSDDKVPAQREIGFHTVMREEGRGGKDCKSKN